MPRISPHHGRQRNLTLFPEAVVVQRQWKSDLAVDMLLSGTTEKTRISTFIMDEDLAAMAKLRKSVPHEVTKESDINLAKKLLEMIYIPYKKFTTYFHLNLFPTFKNVFHTQSSSTRWFSTQKGKYSKYSFSLLWIPCRMWWKVMQRKIWRKLYAQIIAIWKRFMWGRIKKRI